MSACKSKLEALHEKLIEVLGPGPAGTLMYYLGYEPATQDDQRRLTDQLQSGLRQLSATELRLAEQSCRLTDELADQDRRFSNKLAELERCFSTKLAEQKHQLEMESLSAEKARLDAEVRKHNAKLKQQTGTDGLTVIYISVYVMLMIITIVLSVAAWS